VPAYRGNGRADRRLRPEVRAVGPVPIKGLEKPLELFELVGAGSARTRLQAHAARGLTRFVGRHTELERCDALAQRWNLPRILSFSASLLGAAYAMAGRHSDSVALLDRAATHIDAAEGGSESRLAPPLAEGYLCVGRFDQATRLVERALAASRKRKERGYEAQALRLLGEVALHGGRDDDHRAEARFRESRTLANALGMRPLAVRCDLGLGKVYRRMGKRAASRAELDTAVEMLRALEMNYWLPEAESELAAVS
jgi:tetratricopeptide (TPR) repeat protein